MVPFSGYCCIRHVTKVLIISNKLSILFSILSLRMSRTPTTSRWLRYLIWLRTAQSGSFQQRLLLRTLVVPASNDGDDDYYYFLTLRKTRVGKKLKKLRKNRKANVPSSHPTQNCCATKQNWTKQKCVETKMWFLCYLQTWEIIRPRLARNLRASQFMGPRDSTAIGWKVYWSSSALYFATLRVAANSATAPAEAVADCR